MDDSKSIDGLKMQLEASMNAILKKGNATEEIISLYNQRHPYFVTLSAENNYNGPKYAARFAHKYLGDRLDSKILDVAAGAGAVGFELSKLGYTNLHALEPAVEYFEKSPHRGLYQSLISVILGESNADIRDGEYDAIVISGGFAEGHIPCSALPEMIRIVKPGGYIISAMREVFLTEVEEYAGKLEPYMKELEEKGRWKIMERSIVENYLREANGVVHAFLITKGQ